MDQLKCSICDDVLSKSFGAEFASNYPNLVCRECDRQALTQDGRKPNHNIHGDFGDNPVFIHGIKCWRRYRLGGFVSMRDVFDCQTAEEFHERNFDFKGR